MNMYVMSESKVFINPNGEVLDRIGAKPDMTRETRLVCGLMPGSRIVITGQHVRENGNLMYSFIPKDIQNGNPVQLRPFDPESTMWTLAEGIPTQAESVTTTTYTSSKGSLTVKYNADGHISGFSADMIIPKREIPELTEFIDRGKTIIPNLKCEISEPEPESEPKK